MNTSVGSISHGTLLNSDLIPAFFAELDDEDKRRLVAKYPAILDSLLDNELEGTPDYNTEEAHELLEELFDIFNEHAPPGTYFGAHPGDGSDFGFWYHEP